jgi:hypothetical protein
MTLALALLPALLAAAIFALTLSLRAGARAAAPAQCDNVFHPARGVVDSASAPVSRSGPARASRRPAPAGAAAPDAVDQPDPRGRDSLMYPPRHTTEQRYM